MLKIELATTQNKSPVYLHPGILKLTGQMLKRSFTPCPVLLVTDKNTWRYYGEICKRSLLEENYLPFVAVLEGGEKVKTLQSAYKLYGFALRKGLDRKSLVVALGGGVIGDLAGFVASTYMRGIPLVQVPTTLLAMVDSSVGGKVAVNHPLGKNIIGSFYQPARVLIDPGTLKTLPHREFSAGLAELIKYGIIMDRNFFLQFERLSNNKLIKLKNDQRLLKFLAKAVLLKGKVVTLDEKEEGLRKILNFGHTFAHALEAATSYTYYLHGEAVALGMIAATRLATRLKMIEEETAGRILTLLSCLNPPPPPPGLTKGSVLDALQADKKKEGKELIFILPITIGRTVTYMAPPEEDVTAVINEYLSIPLKARKG